MPTRLSTLHAGLVFFGILSALYAVFIYVPSEQEMGVVQRIFYFHVPSAIASYIAFFLVFIGSVQYLRTQEAKWDQLALSAAELGVLFGLIVLITGPIWAKPIWGVWWRWEPRLTSLLIMFAIYVAYLLVRNYGVDAPQIQRFAAVLGILGFVNVPLVHFSVQLWAAEQQLHPREVALLDPRMLHARYICFAAIFLLFSYLLKRRLEIERASHQLALLQQEVEEMP